MQISIKNEVLNKGKASFCTLIIIQMKSFHREQLVVLLWSFFLSGTCSQRELWIVSG